MYDIQEYYMNKIAAPDMAVPGDNEKPAEEGGSVKAPSSNKTPDSGFNYTEAKPSEAGTAADDILSPKDSAAVFKYPSKPGDPITHRYVPTKDLGKVIPHYKPTPPALNNTDQARLEELNDLYRSGTITPEQKGEWERLATADSGGVPDPHMYQIYTEKEKMQAEQRRKREAENRAIIRTLEQNRDDAVKNEPWYAQGSRDAKDFVGTLPLVYPLTYLWPTTKESRKVIDTEQKLKEERAKQTLDERRHRLSDVVGEDKATEVTGVDAKGNIPIKNRVNNLFKWIGNNPKTSMAAAYVLYKMFSGGGGGYQMGPQGGYGMAPQQGNFVTRHPVLSTAALGAGLYGGYKGAFGEDIQNLLSNLWNGKKYPKVGNTTTPKKENAVSESVKKGEEGLKDAEKIVANAGKGKVQPQAK